MGTKSSADKSDARTRKQQTLYCSFCGKSQHEVGKLIAGPSTFICDECVWLCEDILWDKLSDRLIVKARVPSGSDLDDVLFETISRLVSEKYPDLEFKYECKTQSAGEYPTESGHSYAIYTFKSNADDDSRREISLELSKMISELAVTKTKFLNESEKRKRIELELSELKDEYLTHLRKVYAENTPEDTNLLVVMFLDVSGFSKFASDEKRKVVDTIRGISLPILGMSGGEKINMWGDAIVANFSEVNDAIECAIKFKRHLSVEQLDIRIGMSWGQVRYKFNPVLGRKDVDGAVVDYAARLESFAEVGEILLGEEFGGLDIMTGKVELVPKKVTVKKAFADKNVGDQINVYQLRIKSN